MFEIAQNNGAVEAGSRLVEIVLESEFRMAD